ncbi:hypothetical protein T05_14486 [Trichinella murrelli]|uniref:Uncharacterized protein n=1 Tax=Trichinella murrelli TaxID=144512 RepID=A0A0V0U6I0_9BILA|nr:hypothetical protein T05_14486 [Trichinella murrelli]
MAIQIQLDQYSWIGFMISLTIINIVASIFGIFIFLRSKESFKNSISYDSAPTVLFNDLPIASTGILNSYIQSCDEISFQEQHL